MERKLFLSLLALTTVTLSVSAQEATTITTHPVAANIYMLEGQGGNIGVSVGDDGILIIDDQFDRMVPAIREAVGKLSSGNLEFVLNTHHHGDHTGGNQKLGEEAHIIAHTNTRGRLLGNKDPNDPALKTALPVITFDESLSLHFNGEEIKAIHFPAGHTDTDIVIFFTKSNVVHMGDHYFSGRFPFIDLASGGTVDGYIANVRKVLEHLPDDVKVIPGHGPLSDKAGLQQFADTLAGTRDLVKGKIDAGKTREQIKEEGLPEDLKDWSWQFVNTDRWLDTLYTDLTK